MIKMNEIEYISIKEAANFIGIKYPILYMYIKKFNILEIEGKKLLPVEEVKQFKELRELKARVNALKEKLNFKR